MNHELTVSRRAAGQVLILDLQGDLTKKSEEILMNYHPWEDGLPDGKTYAVLNLTGVPYINSAGIALLIRFTRTGMKSGYHTFAYGVSPHYQKLFRMVGLSEHMMVYPDEYAVMQRIEQLDR